MSIITATIMVTDMTIASSVISAPPVSAEDCLR